MNFENGLLLSPEGSQIMIRYYESANQLPVPRPFVLPRFHPKRLLKQHINCVSSKEIRTIMYELNRQSVLIAVCP